MASSQSVKGYKVVLLGDMGAGKSSIASRFIKESFDPNSASTIGAAFMTKMLPAKGVKLEIWDTAGQERYHSLAPMYYRGAHAAIIVFDLTSADSFEKANKWVSELHAQGGPNLIIALAANKADMSDSRAVTTASAEAFAEQKRLDLVLETSARTGQNVQELFDTLADKIVAQDQNAPEPPGMDTGISLNEAAATTKSSCC